MEDKIYLYIDEMGFISHSSINEIEYKGYDSIRVPVNGEESLIKVQQLARDELNFYGRKYKLTQKENGDYFLRNVYFVYYSDTEQILSISPVRTDDYADNDLIKCRAILEDDYIKSIIDGEKSLFLFTLEEKGENFVILKEKEFANDLWKGFSVRSSKIKLTKRKAPTFTYLRKKGMISIERPPDFVSSSFWLFITKKYDPTIIYYTANEFELTEKDMIQMYGVPNLPDSFDIYSNLPNSCYYTFKVFKEK